MKTSNITGIILFIVIAFCSCEVNGQIKHKKKKQLLKEITYGAPLSGTQLNAGTSTLTATFTTPTNVGIYTVQSNIGYNTNYLRQPDKPKPNIVIKYLLAALPYIAIALSILLAIFLFRRNRDEVITLPDEYLNEQL